MLSVKFSHKNLHMTKKGYVRVLVLHAPTHGGKDQNERLGQGPSQVCQHTESGSYGDLTTLMGR